MALTISIALITTLLMIVSVLTKPYIKIGTKQIGLYWIICFIGALFTLLTGCVSPEAVFMGLTANTSVNPLKILTLFLSMTFLSVYLGEAGFFDYVADTVFLKSKGGQLKLFFILYAVVSVLTVFTSNDVIILTFTPPICIFAKKVKISPHPFLFGEFIAANTWSMALIIGNPTNVYLAQSAGINFTQYFSVMFLPAIAGGITSLVVLLFIFRKQLALPVGKAEPEPKQTTVHLSKVPMIVAIVHLLIGIILLAIADVLHMEMYLICLLLALSLIAFDVVYELVVVHSVKPVIKSLKKEPYELIPFVLSMFIIVLALKQSGATQIVAQNLITNTKLDCLSFGVLSTFGANLLNNIPMSVLFEKIISGQSLFAVYGSIIGANVGAFLTPVGALAGIMWSKILSTYGVAMPFKKFVFYGSIIATATLLASVGVLCLAL